MYAPHPNLWLDKRQKKKFQLGVAPIGTMVAMWFGCSKSITYYQ